jgi:putative holliday junction resolvase
MRSIGLDIGEKRIGIAMSDPDEILATPLITIIRDSDDNAIKSICDLVLHNMVHLIVIGLPYSLKGDIGQQAVKVMEFANKLAVSVNVDIQYQDERYSTVMADQLMIQAGAKSKKRRDKRDAAAAALILQSYLDTLDREGPE